MIELILGLGNIFAVLVGAFIGALGGAYWAYKYSQKTLEVQVKQAREREKELQDEHSRRIRAILHLEIEQNLALLADHWKTKVSRLPWNFPSTQLEKELQMRINLIQEPLPPLSRLIWESEAANLPSILTEQQLEAVFTLYTKLDWLPVLRASLSSMLHPKMSPQFSAWLESSRKTSKPLEEVPTGMYVTDSYGGGRPMNLYEAIDQFNKETEELWKKCTEILKINPATANPLSRDYLKPTI